VYGACRPSGRPRAQKRSSIAVQVARNVIEYGSIIDTRVPMPVFR
jgi:hypothetical protein